MKNLKKEMIILSIFIQKKKNLIIKNLFMKRIMILKKRDTFLISRKMMLFQFKLDLVNNSVIVAKIKIPLNSFSNKALK